MAKAVSYLKQYKNGLQHNTSVERAGAGTMSTLAEKPRLKQNSKGKKPMTSLKPEDKCMGCEWAKHGSGSTRDREQNCTAWGKTCNRCKRTNHFFNVCK